MPSTKIADLTIKVGEYQSGGVTKGEYQNIGQVLRTDKGDDLLLIESWALSSSLLRLVNPDNRRRVIINRFEANRDGAAPARTGAQTAVGDDGAIPF